MSHQNEIVVHIGMHRTGTTSLQKSYFPNIYGYKFIGRKSIPLEHQSDLYERIMRFCCSKDESVITEKAIRIEIARELQTSSILISDEWYTADYSGYFGIDGVRWREKLTRLSKLLFGQKSKILLTLRDPIGGLHSQYIELSGFYRTKDNNDLDSYLGSSSDCSAYHYQDLIEFLTSNFDNLIVFDYKFILKETNAVSEIAFGVVTNVSIGHENRRIKRGDGVLSYGKKNILSQLWSRVPRVFQAVLRNMKGYELLRYLIYQSRLQQKTKFKYLTNAEQAELEQRYASAREYYENLSCEGFKYYRR